MTLMKELEEHMEDRKVNQYSGAESVNNVTLSL